MADAAFERRKTFETLFECYVSEQRTGRWSVQPHYHDFVELLYILNGTVFIEAYGREHKVSVGDFVVIGSRDIHAIRPADAQPSQYVVLKFDPSLISSTSREYFTFKYIQPFVERESSYKRVFYRDIVHKSSIPDIIKTMRQESQTQSYAYEIAVRIGILQIFLWIFRVGIADEQLTAPQEQGLAYGELSAVFEYVDKHYQEELSAEEAAKICRMSYSSFSRKFRMLTGRRFIEYVNFVRINEAEKMMVRTDWTITQIAAETGFSNVSYFIKQFQRYKKIPPKQYLKKLRLQSRTRQ